MCYNICKHRILTPPPHNEMSCHHFPVSNLLSNVSSSTNFSCLPSKVPPPTVLDGTCGFTGFVGLEGLDGLDGLDGFDGLDG